MANDVHTKGDYVDRAEGLMVELHKFISTSKIRDLLSQVNELYNDITLESGEILKKICRRIRHLELR